ncbi:MAG: hypothetical protein DRO11_03310 [Methanobacteriota archaeon]|nr:MAG: hypothetical protein DRO11_03310 [Euryarchaeota archaeon]
MNRTRIDYVVNPDGTPGFTWNPVVGCKHGCPYCYARRQAKRQKHRCFDCYVFKPHLHRERLSQPLTRRKPATIFAVDMGDLFGAWVPNQWISLVFDVIAKTPQHQYLLLTKNPGRYLELDFFPGNAWFGLTVTKNKELGKLRLARELLGMGAKTWVSIEPLLEDLDLPNNIGVNWVVIGAQTGSKNRVKPGSRWVQRIVDLSHRNKIPVFMKNNLLPYLENLVKEFPQGLGPGKK